jgi:hypothetical protein
MQKDSFVTKYTGQQEPFSWEKIKKNYFAIAGDLAEQCSFELFQQELARYVVPGMSTKDIMHMMIKTAINLISLENIHWQVLA